jgi:hypothetical protein
MVIAHYRTRTVIFSQSIYDPWNIAKAEEQTHVLPPLQLAKVKVFFSSRKIRDKRSKNR